MPAGQLIPRLTHVKRLQIGHGMRGTFSSLEIVAPQVLHVGHGQFGSSFGSGPLGIFFKKSQLFRIVSMLLLAKIDTLGRYLVVASVELEVVTLMPLSHSEVVKLQSPLNNACIIEL
jgi:hypothetical protein